MIDTLPLLVRPLNAEILEDGAPHVKRLLFDKTHLINHNIIVATITNSTHVYPDSFPT